jgi:single-stranded-DNA-specific exonuclease
VSLPRGRWSCSPYAYAGARALARELGISPVLAAILARRGYGSPDAARRFLAAADRHPPAGFAGIDRACETILRHVGDRSPIVVHGDYDVDGVCATAVLVRALRVLGADPGRYIPSRVDEGYGLSVETVERLAAQGARLLVTVDCGIVSAAEVARARELGMDVVVTDHHRPADVLPDCPLVHPAVCGYPFSDLCGAAVAHKLAQALLAAAGADPAAVDEDLDLVALATICDVVPLTGENRRLAREGLRALERTRKPGLRALMRVASVDPAAGLDARAAGFRLGPRLNAAGRMQRADAALELLLTDDERRAAEVADELDLLNRERRDVETRILFAAEAARPPQDAQAAFVLAGEEWHPGVIGIVASRMVERHGRPCVLIAVGPGGGRGSGRSVAAYDLHAGLAACASQLRRFGGHRAAAGLEIEPQRIDGFRGALARHAAQALSPQDLVALEPVDAVASCADLGLGLAEELRRLGPFGQGNPEPSLLVPAARTADVRAMGDDGQHARLTLASGGARARAVAFRTSPAALRALAGEPQDVIVRLERNEWNGAVEPRAVLRAASATSRAAVLVLGEDEPFWAAVERELRAPQPERRPGAAAPPRVRDVLEHPGASTATLVADILSAGDSALLLCASTARRRDGVERLLGRLAGGRLALASWDALALDPVLAAGYEHVVALDPAPLPAAEELAAAAPGGAFAHLPRGESAFALAVAEAELDLRPALVAVFRALREAGGAAGGELERHLRGGGRFARTPAVCGRLLRVLSELELVELDIEGRACRAAAGAARTELESSPAYRTYQARLAAIRGHLAPAARRAA